MDNTCTNCLFYDIIYDMGACIPVCTIEDDLLLASKRYSTYIVSKKKRCKYHCTMDTMKRFIILTDIIKKENNDE